MLQKLQFRPGLNREGTDYSNEGGWYDGDKIRFRSGFPEKIGGWTPHEPGTPTQFLGICRSLWTWLDADLGAGASYIGIGTSHKYYIYSGGTYNDVTPIVATTTGATLTTVEYQVITAAVTSTSTTISLVSAANYPSVGVIKIGTEIIRYTGKSGNSLTGCIRGYNGSAAAAHAVSAIVNSFSIHVVDAGYTPTIPSYLYIATSISVGGATVVGDYRVDVRGTTSTDYYASPSLLNTTATAATGYAAYGSAVPMQYELAPGADSFSTGAGWGAGTWSRGRWSSASTSVVGIQLRLWSADNFGSDLVIAPRGGAMYYWADSGGVGQRAKSLVSLANTTTAFSDASTFGAGATSITVTSANAPYVYPLMYITGTGLPANTQVVSTYTPGSTTVPITTTTTLASSGSYNFSYSGAFVPSATYQAITSSIQEFVIAFGANTYNPTNSATAFNSMLVRWSDQANPYQWIPQVTNQSGEYLLTNGSYIVGARTTRQEILVWTDTCLYSMQYLGAPYVWGFQVLMDNITVISPNSMMTVNNVTYWLGRDKFFMYSGRVEVLPCAVRQYIFADLNFDQAYQIFACTNNAFNEIWWFYVSKSSGGTTIDRYVVYNYLDRVWYYGSLNRTAWIQSGLQPYPIAALYNADRGSSQLVDHEDGTDDVATGIAQPISAYVQSSDFDIGDGHNFGFVWRILPDVNFNGSTVNQPSVTMTVKPRRNSGTPYAAADSPTVVSANNYAVLPQYTIQEFTGQVYTRLRGRQMSFKIDSSSLGVAWQLGSPRIDVRPDGRR